MRRARNKLQVSTFPFLAVLLCAMGALILFLLVMDRRAKLVARNKAQEVQSARSEKQRQREAADQAAWEQQRDRLHQTLQEQQAQARKEAEAVQRRLAEVQRRLDAQQARTRELQQALARENARLQQGQQLVQTRQASLQEIQAREESAQVERVKLGQDLQDLEKVLDELQAVKKREQQTYSVVPYRGKRGDGRAPIYVECVRDGLVLHPDRKRLDGVQFDVANLRGEIERRAGGLVRETKKKAEEGQAAPGPYVLFLVRPDGISSYYKAQAALRGFRLDFGYEVVDQHWVLDFSKADVALPTGSPTPTQAKTVASAPNLLLPGLPPPSEKVAAGGFPPPTGPGGFPNPAPPAFSPGGGINPGGPAVGKGEVTPKFVPVTEQAAPVPIASAGPGAPKVEDSAADPVVAATGEPTTTPGPKKTDDGPTSGGERQGRPPLELPGQERPPTPPLGNLIGNRDFVVSVVCFDDHVTVYPGGAQHWWKKHPDRKVTDQAIALNVRQLIDSRQASVRPGEPPYRPTIRFQVSADGLRTFLHVYPLLERLRVPMTRETLDE